MNAAYLRRRRPRLLERGILGYRQHCRQIRDDIDAIRKAMKRERR